MCRPNGRSPSHRGSSRAGLLGKSCRAKNVGIKAFGVGCTWTSELALPTPTPAEYPARRHGQPMTCASLTATTRSFSATLATTSSIRHPQSVVQLQQPKYSDLEWPAAGLAGVRRSELCAEAAQRPAATPARRFGDDCGLPPWAASTDIDDRTDALTHLCHPGEHIHWPLGHDATSDASSASLLE